jgi:hypothetical protein
MKDFTIFGDLDITEGRAVVRSIKAADFCTRDEAIAHPCGPTFIMPDVFKGEVLYTHDVMRDLVMKLIESPPPQAATREAMRAALEALSRFMDDSPRPSDALFGRQAIDALRAALGEE